MSVDHLKSVTSIGNVDDTSLALPSISQGRSGQQRVLEQVQSIRRTKSRHASSRSGSTSLSPTSPLNDGVFIDGFRSQSNTTNGSAFFGNGFSKTLSLEKNHNRQVVNNNSKGTSVKRSTAATTYHYERYAPIGSMTTGQRNTSRSEPDVGRLLSMPKPSATSQRMVSNKSLYRTQRSTSQFITSPTAQLSPVFTTNGTAQTKKTNQFIVEVPQKTKKASVTDGTLKAVGSNGNRKAADITMKDAVEYLSMDVEAFQHCGASYIQHSTFMDDTAKEEVLKLRGIPPLVALLRSPNVEVSSTAAAALRNLSFKSEKNKEEIQKCSGISEAVAVLRDTNCVDLHKQLTGLLWNLSSADSMKSELLKSALPVLTEHVILPYTTGPNRASGDSKDDVFLHATGCLRNLSSSQQSNRQAMRKCRGLVDSLAAYIKDCVEAGKTNDESVENCMCILHNLTFQLEAEAPSLFSRITALAPTVNRSSSQSNVSPVGCFSSPSRSQEQQPHFDFPVLEDPQPNGAAWLIHSQTLQSYLSLLRLSQREEIQEASCGAMQNLTANEGIVSSVMTQTIVQKLNGLHFITPLINSKRVNLQRNAVALVGNFTKMPNLHSALARKGLPELISLLSKGTAEGNESDDNLAMACQTASCLLMKKPEMSKNLLNDKLIKSLNDLSQNIYFPKSRKAASLLLYKLWSDKDLQSFLKKQGMSKSSFVNDTTVEAHRSLQVID
ncbi:plakophilin-1 isoform X2 [Parambassis ranga]|uniref:Plakophilin-1 isoform X2 n=1 Tax=Parambassis ranga TaxID=210632 RepID=A0A6P7IKL2_9TELE|nr:plakophilin-1-like isoform X2 [Parambassis ranga]